MSKLLVTLTVIGVLLMACASEPTPTPSSRYVPPEARPTPRIPNRVYYTKRCWPACHYGEHPDVPEPQISEFESRVLEADWRWINEDDTHWTLSEAPGTLRIVSQGGAPAGDLQNAPNVLVRDAPDGHFDLLTEVTFNPTSHCQYASIFVQLDDGSVVSLSRSYCEEDEASHCVGSGIYFDASDLGCDPIGVPTSDETVRMLLRKAGRTYIGYRKEGEGWGDVIEIGRCSSSATPSIVGLTAFNSDREIPQIAADFDYFTVQERQ